MSRYPTRRDGAIPSKTTGNYLAHRHLSKRQRAMIAAAAMDGRTEFVEFTQTQIARHCGVSVAYARKMRQPQGVLQLVDAAE
jgi:hypothetical protein